MSTTIPLVTAKAELSAIVEEVASTHEQVTITRNGVPVVVMVAVADFEGLLETLAILSEPDALAQIREAQAELAAGATPVDLAELKAQVAGRGDAP